MIKRAMMIGLICWCSCLFCQRYARFRQLGFDLGCCGGHPPEGFSREVHSNCTRRLRMPNTVLFFSLRLSFRHEEATERVLEPLSQKRASRKRPLDPAVLASTKTETGYVRADSSGGKRELWVN